jgi:hypothetical protein
LSHFSYFLVDFIKFFAEKLVKKLMDNNNQEEISIKELQRSLQGKVLLPADAGYKEAKELWNGAVSYRPALIVLPETVEDVKIAVVYARDHHMPLSVLGAGHDWAGRALNDDGLVISLRKFKKIHIDTDSRIARVEGGVTAGELITAADPHNLVAVTGTIGVVGLAGLTLGGGYGPLSPTYGLAIDNLLAAEVVLPDGTLVTASATENPDLFWATKGGGGNFGVVTSMTIQMHKAKPILGGLILFSFTEAHTVLKSYARIMASAPDELSMLAGVIPAPDGSPLLFLAPAWYGDLDDGEQKIAEIQKLGNPVMVQISPMRYKDLLAIFDVHIVNGRHCEVQTRWLPVLTDHAIAVIVKAAAERSSNLSLINIHHFHGKSTRVGLPETAFGIRRPHFMMEIIPVWEAQDSVHSHLHRQWGHDLSDSLIEDALPGGYPNLLGPNEHEQISKAHGENLQRLQQVKMKYDPQNVFKGIAIHF